jgi:hypothetical protein
MIPKPGIHEKDTRDENQGEALQKGRCEECGYYEDCPRMKGIDHCRGVKNARHGKGMSCGDVSRKP